MKENGWLSKDKAKALARLHASASGYVLVKKFRAGQRAGLREAIDDGTVVIIDTVFGRAYSLTCPPIES